MRNKTGYILLIFTIFFINCKNNTAKISLPEDTVDESIQNVDESLATNINESEIKFDEENYDFKEIEKGDKVTHVFTFTNVGNKPLIISVVQPSCGCTTPEYTKEPVAPGGKGSITVNFDSTGFEGNVFKTVSVAGNFETRVIQFQAKIK